jgi:hypothetical protein
MKCSERWKKRSGRRPLVARLERWSLAYDSTWRHGNDTTYEARDWLPGRHICSAAQLVRWLRNARFTWSMFSEVMVPLNKDPGSCSLELTAQCMSVEDIWHTVVVS